LATESQNEFWKQSLREEGCWNVEEEMGKRGVERMQTNCCIQEIDIYQQEEGVTGGKKQGRT